MPDFCLVILGHCGGCVEKSGEEVAANIADFGTGAVQTVKHIDDMFMG